MRKQLLKIHLLLSALFIFFCNAFAATNTKVYSLEENFTTTPASNWGFATVTGQTFAYDATNKLLQFRYTATSYTTKTLADAITMGTDNKITVESIVKFYTSGNSSSGGTLYFLDSNGYAVFGIAFSRSSSQWRIGRATDYPGAAVQTALPARTDYLAADQPTAKITAVLDMSAKTLSYTATVGTYDYTARTFTAGSTTVSSTSQAFINSSANDIKSIQSNYFKSSSLTGTNGFDLVYLGISTEKTVATADVTVKFKDQDGNEFKTAETASAQVVGATYTATSAQKADVTLNSNYYVLIPDSASSVVVGNTGSTLNLRFRRSTLYSSMVWNGTTGTNTDSWSTWYQNFINGATSTSYQKDASVTFDATAANKAVIVNENITMGAGNITIGADGYSLTGTGSISGTGALTINLADGNLLTLGVTNNLTSATQINGGTITLNKAGTLGSAVTINNPSTIITNYNLPATTFNAATTVSSAAPMTLAGMTAASGTKVSLVSNYATANAAYAMSIAASGTMNGELELTGSGTSENKFGITSVATNFLSAAKVTLKGYAYLFVDATLSAPSTINLGSLSGETNSVLGWGKGSTLTNDVTWSVGSLNENTTYAGSLSNKGGYNSSGNFFAGNLTHLVKEGTGTLTMSGTANTHNGNFTVNNGTLEVTGKIGNATSTTTVAAAGKLKGNGTVGGAATINGTLEGSLNFGSSLTLVGTTNITVNGFGATQYDSITVAGALTNGGNLNITVSGAAPALGSTIKLIKAGTITGTFANVSVPSNYLYNQSTGVLYYGTYTNVSNTKAESLQVYPTMTTGVININGQDASRAEIFNIAGQTVKQVNNLSATNSVNISDLSNGAYLVKVQFADGSAKTQRILLQK